MKKLTSIALLAIAGFGLIGTSALAQSPLTYTAGDLLLGFRASGGTGSDKDYVVNIGQLGTYTGATGAFAVSGLGNIKADLDATFGSTWSSRADVHWGVSGTNTNLPSGTVAGEPARTLFATKAQSNPGTLNSVRWQRGTSTTQAIPAGKMVAAANYFTYVNGDGITPQTSTVNSPKGRVQNKTDVNSYASYMPGGTAANAGGAPGISYAYFNPTIEGAFGSGTSSILEMYRMQPGSGQGDLVGFFSLDGNGTLMFFPASYTGSGSVSGGNATLQFQQAAYSVSEGATTASITIVRGGNLSSALSVTVDTADGSATAGTDYTAISGQVVNFAANEIQKTVTVTLAGEQAGFQPDRDFTMALSNAPVGVDVMSPVTVTIEDTTPAPIGFASATYTHAPKNNLGIDQLTFDITVERDNGRGTASGTVGYDNSFTQAPGHTKLATPTHFTLTGAGAISFAEGETSKTITVTIGSTIPTPGQFRLAITGASPDVVAGLDKTVATIVKKDTSKPVVVLTTPGSTVPAPGTFDIAGTVKDDNAQDLDLFSVTLNGVSVSGVTRAPYAANAAAAFSKTGLQAENGTNTLVITARDAQGNLTVLTKNFTFVNSALGTAVAGVYNGVLVPDGTADNDKSGFVTITVSSTASLSGKVTVGGSTIGFTGILTNAGVARFKPTLATAFDIIDKVDFESYLGALSFSVSPGQANGQLSTDATGATALATFTAPLCPFSSSNLITGAILNQGTKGVYNVALPSEAQPSPIGLDPANWPQGDGAATLTLTNTGSVTFKGYLADGSPFTAAGKLAAGNTAALHANMYKKTGSIAGVLEIDLGETDTDVTGSDLLWLRPALPRARYYTAGWPNGITVDAIGTAFDKPGDLDFGQGADALPAPGNATLEFSLGLLTSTVTRGVNVNSTSGLVKHVPISGADHKLALTVGTGLFTGYFTHTDGKLPAYKGVLLKKTGGSLNRGYGYFLSVPASFAYGVTGESGLVKLLP